MLVYFLILCYSVCFAFIGMRVVFLLSIYYIWMCFLQQVSVWVWHIICSLCIVYGVFVEYFNLFCCIVQCVFALELTMFCCICCIYVRVGVYVFSLHSLLCLCCIVYSFCVVNFAVCWLYMFRCFLCICAVFWICLNMFVV